MGSQQQNLSNSLNHSGHIDGRQHAAVAPSGAALPQATGKSEAGGVAVGYAPAQHVAKCRRRRVVVEGLPAGERVGLVLMARLGQRQRGYSRQVAVSTNAVLPLPAGMKMSS